jgi:spore germination protein
VHKAKALVTFVLIAGLAAFGGSQYYANRAYRMQLEAGYVRAFRELAVHIGSLETELSKLLVANSTTQQFGGLANILRLVYAAQANFGQLPVYGLSLARIESLLAQVQTATVKAAQGIYSAQPLGSSSNEGPAVRTQFARLYEQIQYVNSELQSQLALGERSTSWVSWRKFIQASISQAAEVAPGDRYPLMQALLMIEDGMERFADSDFPSELGRLKGPLPAGELISASEAVAIARAFLPQTYSQTGFVVDPAITNEGEGELPTYTVTATSAEQNPVTIEIAKQGGHVLWMTNPRVVREQQLSQAEMIKAAEQFLKERAFPEVELVDANFNFNRLLCSFAPVDDGILIYPRQLKVQVAADNGEIVGYQGLVYQSFVYSGETTPALNPEQAQKYVIETAEIVDRRLAVILDSNFDPVLTYQFRADHGADQFLIYINAENGAEERITRVEPE